MHNLFAKHGSLHPPEQPMPVLLCGYFAFPQFWRPWCSEQTLFSMKTNRLFIKHFQFFARDFLHRGSPKPVTAAQASIALDYCNTEAKMYQSAQKTTRCQRAHKGFGTQNAPNATAFCSSRSPMPFLNPNPLSQKTANSAGFKTWRNAAITQSKRNATLLFEAQFAFSNSVPHFFSLPHRMLVLCFLPFLRFWTQNAPNPTRFCTFAPFSGLERWREAENSPFST